MTDLRKAAQQALDFIVATNKSSQFWLVPESNLNKTVTALRAALAQQEEPQTLDEALTPPRAMAQAYENGYNAGVAHEREACAQVCEARFMGDLTREDMEARRCAAAIRARNNP